MDPDDRNRPPSLEDLLRQAAEAYRLGQYRSALEGYQAACSLLEEGRLPPDPVLHANIATCALALELPDQALTHATLALDIARESGDRPAQAKAQAGLGHAHQRLGSLDEAVTAFEAASTLFEEEGEAYWAMGMRVALGNVLAQKNELQASVQAFQAALPHLRSLAGPADLVSVLVSLGGLLYLTGNPIHALELLQEAAVALPGDLAGTALETRLAANRGLALLAVGQLEEAARDLTSAREGYRALGDHRFEAEQAARLSDVHRYLGDLPRAIQYHLEVLELEKRHGLKIGEAGKLYSLVEDRSLQVNELRRPVSGAQSASDPVAEGDVAPAGYRHGTRRRGLGHPPHPVVLLVPPLESFSGPLFPRGVTSIASFLNSRGTPAEVIPLSHLVDVYADSVRCSGETRHVIQDILGTFEPRAIGIGAPFTYVYPDSLEIARLVRQLDDQVPIILGGPHVSYWDRECLREAPQVDVVVRGEGEWTMLELIHALGDGGDLARIAGITWRDSSGTVHRNPPRPVGDMNELPEIDFDLLPRSFCEQMEVHGITSRGCAHRCRFCHEYRYWGGKVRHYPVEQVIGEMERLFARYGNRMLGIDDSMLDMRTPYFYSLCERLSRCSARIDSFGLLSRVDTITPEGLARAKSAGVAWLQVGVESGSDRVLQAMNKGFTVAEALEGLGLCRESGINLAAFFIVGHPGDDLEQSQMTLDLIERMFREDLAAFIDPATFGPYPGTPAFTDPGRYGVEILTTDWHLWRRTNRPICQLDGYSAGEIYLTFLRMLELMSRYRGFAG